MPSGARTILLVEDDQNDVFFFQYAFREAGIDNPIQVANDGQQAIDYLSGNGEYSNRERFPFPCLVFLDLKLPVKMGLDVLRWLQKQPKLKNLLVLVLTSSSNLTDIDEVYRLGARAFLVKPVSTDKRIAMARIIKQFWLELNEPSSLGAQGPQ
jgi:two-component system response regulator